MLTPDQFAASRRILVRGLNWIGDAVMSLPLLWTLRNHLPECRITALAPPWSADVYSLCPAVDQVVQSEPHKSGLAGARQEFELARRLQEHSFDAALILPNSFRSAIAPWRAGIPLRIGYGTDGRGILLDPFVPKKYRPTGPTVLYYLPVMQHLEIDWPRGEECFNMEIPPVHAERSAQLLVTYGVEPGTDIIGMSPGAAWGPSKRWPAERFSETAGLLVSQGYTVVLFGSPADTERNNAIVRTAGQGVVNMAGAFDHLGQLVATIDTCRLLLTNDSGPMHIAAARRVPLVALFGPTDERISGPWKLPGGEAVVLRADDCQPCYNPDCGKGERCLERIRPQTVVDQILKLLRRGV